jgi:hypothetical protein
MNRTNLIFQLLFFIAFCAPAQDVVKEYESLKEALQKEPVKITGTAGFSGTYYTVQGIAARRDPLTAVFNANLQISLANKVTIPFSFIMSTQEKTFSNGLEKYNHAFNQFGISPSYKWLTLHLGYRSIYLSDYSLSGTQFLGAGIEIKPGKSLISGLAAAGRLIRATRAVNSALEVIDPPAYERWVSAVKSRIGTEMHHVEMLFMHIRDGVNSIPADLRNTNLPAENTVLGLATKQNLAQKLKLDLDYSLSLYSPNLFLPLLKEARYTYRNQFFADRVGTRTSSALSGGINYAGKSWQAGIKYKRISPDYLSLGSIFLCNDVEERSINAAYQNPDSKFQIQTALGLQRNNLDELQQSTNQRLIGSVNLNFLFSQKWNLQATYSSFSSNSKPVRDLYSDSIHYLQVSTTANAQSNYGFGTKRIKGQVFALASRQESNSGAQLNRIETYQAGTQLQFSDKGFQISSNILLNKIHLNAGQIMEGHGATMQLQKSLIKNKLQMNLNNSFLRQQQDKKVMSKTILLGAGLQIKPRSAWSFRLDYSFQKRNSLSTAVTGFHEHRLNVICQYTFNKKLKHEPK